jgi:hypothetical protein
MSAEDTVAKVQLPKKKKAPVRKAKKVAKRKSAKPAQRGSGGREKFPRHSVERALRISRAIIEQNAGKECSESDSARYSGVRPCGRI